MKKSLSALPAPGPLCIVTYMPLTLGTYYQRTCVRHVKGEFLRLSFASLNSVTALGFAALSGEHALLSLKLFYPYFKVQLALPPSPNHLYHTDLLFP